MPLGQMDGLLIVFLFLVMQPPLGSGYGIYENLVFYNHLSKCFSTKGLQHPGMPPDLLNGGSSCKKIS